MSIMPEFPTDSEALLKVVKAHESLDNATNSYRKERDELLDQLTRKHNPFIFAAHSVLYEAMGNAALNGFSRPEMVHVMRCDEH